MANDKKKKSKSPVFTVILIICIAVIAFAAYKLISIGLSYREAQSEYETLREYTKETASADAPADGIAEQPETEEESEEADEAKVKEEDNGIPKLKERPPIEVDCKGLAARNPDFACWLYLGAEDISYPVVHYTDNDFYLHRTFDKADNFAGTLFIEYQNQPDFTDANTLIYGHNMKDRSMFGKLKFLYENQDIQKDDSFWILTEDHAYKYKIFSLQITNMESEVYTLFYNTTEEFTKYIADRAAESFVQLPLGKYDENSRIVTLSTCTTVDTPDRFVVQGILVGESAKYGK